MKNMERTGPLPDSQKPNREQWADNTYEKKVEAVAKKLFNIIQENKYPLDWAKSTSQQIYRTEARNILESALSDVRELANKIVVTGAEMPDETAEVLWAKQILSFCPPEPTIDDKVQRIMEYAHTPDGIKELSDALDRSDKFIKYLKDARRIRPESLNKPFCGKPEPEPVSKRGEVEDAVSKAVFCDRENHACNSIEVATDQIIEIFPEPATTVEWNEASERGFDEPGRCATCEGDGSINDGEDFNDYCPECEGSGEKPDDEPEDPKPESEFTIENIPLFVGKEFKHKHGTGSHRILLQSFESDVAIEGMPHRVSFKLFIKDWVPVKAPEVTE